MGPSPQIRLTVRLNSSPIDVGRDVARMHPLVLQTLGISAWDPIEVRGRRRTGCLVAVAQSRWGTHEILLDETLCHNAGAAPGDEVLVAKATALPAERVVVRVEGDSPALEPEVIRLGLLGKVTVAGDVMNLVPQDLIPHEDVDPAAGAGGAPGWSARRCTIVETTPGALVHVTMRTVVEDSRTLDSTATSGTPGAGGAQPLPGAEDVFHRLRERLEVTFRRRELLTQLGSSPRAGILLSGAEGSGKVWTVRAVAEALAVRVHRVWGPELAALEPNAAATRLDAVAKEARDEAPSILLVEDVDALAPRDAASSLVVPLLEEISECLDGGRVAVVCTTARPEATSRELVRPGLVDLELEMPQMQREARRAFLEMHMEGIPAEPGLDLDDIARRTPGFNAADLTALYREAALQAARRIAGDGPPPPAPQSAAAVVAPPRLSAADFDAALEHVRPSALEEQELRIAKVSFDDVGNMDDTKRQLTETIIWPLRHPDALDRLGVAARRGVLLHGPPGCGKTLLVRALANEAEANFFSVKGAELLTKWVGESERGVRELFRRARAAAPSIVFFDEIDALAPRRGSSSGDSGVSDRVVAQLLTELDGLEELGDVAVVAATNRRDLIDPALLRPGRLEAHVEVPPPGEAARRAILESITRKMPMRDVDLGRLAARTHDFSGADLAAVAREAALAAMRENMEAVCIEQRHIDSALERIKPSLAGWKAG